MIPKKIHYCWFGGNPLPPLAVKCIESWKKYLPDYEIKEWNCLLYTSIENEIDLFSITNVRHSVSSEMNTADSG